MTDRLRLGFDFDNTLISYDQVFFDRALADDLIPMSLEQTKVAVRNHLRQAGLEDKWTLLQGEVYGPGIGGAIPFPGALEALTRIRSRGIDTCIVSHKTRRPYAGGDHDLRAAALGWLEDNGFFDQTRLVHGPGDVYFESSVKEKAQRVGTLGCSHFVDDLAEVLEMLPKGVRKIQFAPHVESIDVARWPVLSSWDNLDNFLPESL